MQPIQIFAVAPEGEDELYTAWYDPARDINGLSKKVAAVLDRSERDIGMRVNLDTGHLECIPTPGPAYVDDPEMAEKCK